MLRQTICIPHLRLIYHSVRNYCAKINLDAAPTNSRDVWKPTIGLEIHAQLLTETKLFSSAPAVYGAPTNSCVSLFDASIPGTLPVLNKKAVKLAVLSALSLGCTINPVSYFDRKHYFYSDLPAGYQITQQRLPIAENGKVEYAIFQPEIHKKPYYKVCRIKQVQLEQDSGKSLHEPTENKCFVDLNRAGIALIEIVFEPDVADGEEACALVKEVIAILERVGACTCKMEEGALRVDVNVSISKEGEELGVRTEIKNIGSVHGVSKAIKYEVERQIDLIEKGKEIKNQTLAWDSELNKTVIMRDKEEVLDYRFMPEPNLPPLRLVIDEYSENLHKNAKSKASILDLKGVKNEIPESPQEERIMLVNKFGLSDLFAYNLVGQRKLFEYFKEIMKENPSRDPKSTYLLLMYQLIEVLNKNEIELEDCSVSAKYLGEIIDLIQNRKINGATGETLLNEVVSNKTCQSPKEIVEINNLYIISSKKELRKICLRVFEREEELIVAYKKRRKKTYYNSLMKKVIEESKNRADTKVLPKLLSDLLEEHVQ